MGEACAGPSEHSRGKNRQGLCSLNGTLQGGTWTVNKEGNRQSRHAEVLIKVL